MNGTTDFVRQLIHQEVSTGAVQKEEVGVCTHELRCCMSLHAGLDQVQGRDAHMVVLADTVDGIIWLARLVSTFGLN
jgi:hypothetical protein